MNTQLVDSLVQIIQSLSQEERTLLDEKLKKSDARAAFQRLIELGDQINERREGQPFNPPLEDYIQQTREERNEQHDKLTPQVMSPPISDAETKQHFLKSLIERMQQNSIPLNAPRFTRDMLYERR